MKSKNVIINAEEQFKSNNAQIAVDLYKSKHSNELKQTIKFMREHLDRFEEIANSDDLSRIEVVNRRLKNTRIETTELSNFPSSVTRCNAFEKSDAHFLNDASFVLTLCDLLELDEQVEIINNPWRFFSSDVQTLSVSELVKLTSKIQSLSTIESLSVPLICEPFACTCEPFACTHAKPFSTKEQRFYFKIYHAKEYEYAVYCVVEEELYDKLRELNPHMNSQLAA